MPAMSFYTFAMPIQLSDLHWIRMTGIDLLKAVRAENKYSSDFPCY